MPGALREEVQAGRIRRSGLLFSDHVAKMVADLEGAYPLSGRDAVSRLGLDDHTLLLRCFYEIQRCAPCCLMYLRIGSERPCAPISQLWSNRVNSKKAPSKRASRRSHPMKLTRRRSAPEKSAAISETLRNSAPRKFALEKSTLFSSASRQTKPNRPSFSLVVKMRCVPSFEQEQPVAPRTHLPGSLESFLLSIFAPLVALLRSFT
jgi:hypothetical protein